METIRAIDHAWFDIVRFLPHTPWLNQIALFFSGIGKAGLVWIILAAVVFMREEKRHKFFIVQMTITILLSLFLTEGIVKPLVARDRPFTSNVTLSIGSPSFGASFPSSHATVSFAAAFLMTSAHPQLGVVWYILAALISFSRVYLSQHYPIDIIAGALIGTMIAAGIIHVFMTKRNHAKT